MLPRHHISRREFLAWAAMTAAATVLESCSRAQDTITPIADPPVPLAAPSLPLNATTEPSGFEMVLVEAGSFEMGAPDGLSDTVPAHTVNITRPFYIATHEVTVEQFAPFCDETSDCLQDSSWWGEPNQPAIATWHQAGSYCNWLSERAGLRPCYTLAAYASEWDRSADGYRFPTEAEWEYAARGGSRSQGFVYAGSNDIDVVAWHSGNSNSQRQPVGSKAPNELGLYDMSGNVAEWCWDWYSRVYYTNSPSDDPAGPALSTTTSVIAPLKAQRGGSTTSERGYLRVTSRGFAETRGRTSTTGFRLVRSAF